MEEIPTRRRIRHPWWIAAAVSGVVIAGLVAVVTALIPLSSEAARVRLIAALSERLQGEADLREFHIRVFPSLRAEGRGLTIRHHGRHDVPPLISIEHFSAEGSLRGLLRKHVSRVTLDGLDIEIPPDRNRVDKKTDGPDEDKPGAPSQQSDAARTLVIDELRSVKARLAIIPSEAGRPPRVWDIHDMRMTSVSADGAMPFEATLTNAVPPGEITTHGSFGPWQSAEPGGTPLEGTFTFNDADLSVFKGIAGILSSHGTFGGVLERIDIHGQTETPMFEVKAGGHPVPLRTQYHAIVDGTNGNTILERIDASFLKTSIVAKGAVVGKPGKEGRTVTLDVKIDKGRLEDVLKLAVKSSSPMVGGLRLATTFVLPPGDQDVVQKLRLNGRFAISDGRFANLDVQNKINELSQRTQGKDPAQPEAKVSSRFSGAFRLGGGTLAIPEVTFDVPGAAVRLAGKYDLVPETLDFQGTLFTDAKVSQMVKGFKSLILKIVDPLFRREGGGASIPIRISGNRQNPTFGLDKGRVFSHKRKLS
ncbi:MAG: AsmA-like C-terminal region-containing protein [Acidobacteriota bacterium]